MAEAVTNVLHNIGNVLTGVTVSATMADDSLRQSQVTGLTRLVGLLREHQANLAVTVHSESLGTGATFTLELPPVETASAAA